MLKQMKAVKSDSDPFWGCVPLKKERHSTGVCLNGFFCAHFTPSRQGALANGRKWG
jgi:hypothetical protein